MNLSRRINVLASSLSTLMMVVFAIGCDPIADTGYLGEPLLELKGEVSTELSSVDSDDVQVSLIMFAYGPEGDADFEKQEVGDYGFRVVSTEVEGEFPSSFSLTAYELPHDTLGMRIVPQNDDNPELAAMGDFYVYFGFVMAHERNFDVKRCFPYLEAAVGDLGPEAQDLVPEGCRLRDFDRGLKGNVKDNVLVFQKFANEESVLVSVWGAPDEELARAYNDAVQAYDECMDSGVTGAIEAESNSVNEASADSNSNESGTYHNGQYIDDASYSEVYEACEPLYPTNQNELESSAIHEPTNVSFDITLNTKSALERLIPLFEAIEL